jgi:hypothetical protein
VVLVGAHAYFADPLAGLRGLGVDGFLAESPFAAPVPPLPSNVSVAVGGDCAFGGHSGRAWQFFPWLRSDAVLATDPNRLTPASMASIIDGYAGVMQYVSDFGGPFDIQLAAFHRGSRTDPISTAVLWWDPIVQYRIRSAALAELRVRLPHHRRRRRASIDK